MCVCLCICVQVLTRGEGVRSPVAGATGSCEVLHVSAGNSSARAPNILNCRAIIPAPSCRLFSEDKVCPSFFYFIKYRVYFEMCSFCFSVYNLALTTDISGFISPSGRFWVSSRVWWLQWSAFSDLSLVVLGKKNWHKGQEEAELLLKPLASGGFKFFFERIIGKFTFKDKWV